MTDALSMFHLHFEASNSQNEKQGFHLGFQKKL